MAMYVARYGMKRTTLYFPDDLETDLETEAPRRGTTEADIVRHAVDRELRRRAPRGGFMTEGPEDGVSGANLHDHMEGFGRE